MSPITREPTFELLLHPQLLKWIAVRASLVALERLREPLLRVAAISMGGEEGRLWAPPATLAAPILLCVWRLDAKPLLLPDAAPHDILQASINRVEALGTALAFSAWSFPACDLGVIAHACETLSPTGWAASVDLEAVSAHLETFRVEPLLSNEEQQLRERFDSTVFAMCDFINTMQHGSSGMAHGARGGTPARIFVPVAALDETARRISAEQKVIHPAVESLGLYKEELDVWCGTCQA
eukprot:Polyplicarium_translucidae@DN5349_c0_g1_i1.p1